MTSAASAAGSDLTVRLQKLYSAAVHDVLRARGAGPFVLPDTLRPLDPARKLAGPVWTFSGRNDPSASAHDTLLAWTTMLSKAPAEHVIVCQPHNNDIALMGELSAETLQQRRTLGYLADGGCRGEPIRIGSVDIHSGDYLLGDRDGVVIIPQAIAADVIAETEQVTNTESQVRAATRAGTDPVEAYLKYGKF